MLPDNDKRDKRTTPTMDEQSVAKETPSSIAPPQEEKKTVALAIAIAHLHL